MIVSKSTRVVNRICRRMNVCLAAREILNRKASTHSQTCGAPLKSSPLQTADHLERERSEYQPLPIPGCGFMIKTRSLPSGVFSYPYTITPWYSSTHTCTGRLLASSITKNFPRSLGIGRRSAFENPKLRQTNNISPTGIASSQRLPRMVRRSSSTSHDRIKRCASRGWLNTVVPDTDAMALSTQAAQHSE